MTELDWLRGVVNAALAASAIATLGWVFARASRSRIALRHMVLTWCVGLIALTPLITFACHRLPIGVWEWRVAAEPPIARTPEVETADTTPPTVGLPTSVPLLWENPTVVPDPLPSPFDPIPPVSSDLADRAGDTSERTAASGFGFGLAMLWFLGAALVAGRSWKRERHLRRHLRLARATDDRRILDILACAATEVGIAVPRLSVADTIPIPLQVGVFRPRVVIPRRLLRAPHEEVERVLLHELAHIRHHHAATSVIATIARTLFFWNPLVQRVADQLDDAREELADNSVLRAGHSPVALAEQLLELAESALTGSRPLPTRPIAGSAILTRGGLTARIQRLLEDSVTTGISLKHGERWLFVAALAVLTTTVIGTRIAVATIDPTTDTPANDSRTNAEEAHPLAKYLPTGPGGSWTYSTDNDFEVTHRYLGPVVTGLAPTFEFRTDWAPDPADRSYGRSGWRYYGFTDDSIMRYGKAYTGNMPGVSYREPDTLLKLPVTVGNEWKWEGTFAMQTFGDAKLPPREVLAIHYHATIEAVDEVVRVPAGEFKATRVAIHSKGQRHGEHTERIWFAPGVGIVKHDSGNKFGAWTLRRWTPPGKPEEQTAAARTLAERGGYDPAAVTLIEPRSTSAGMESRFFMVTSANGPRFIRVFRDRATWFDPQNINQWNAHYREETRSVRGYSGAMRPGHVAGVFEALKNGVALPLRGFQKRGLRASSRPPTPPSTEKVSTFSSSIAGVDPERGAWVVESTFESVEHELLSVAVEFRWERAGR